MTDSVKFIFKTLFRVPVLILVSYTIFNLFAFSLSYFKLLGFSYVVMQTAVENNYIPDGERVTLNDYLANISDTGVLESAELILENPNDSSIRIATEKRQYGVPVTVGVSANYKFIWPLMPKEQLRNTNDEFIGYGGSAGAFSGYADSATLEARRAATEANVNNINIMYTVPGLKYYPDLN